MTKKITTLTFSLLAFVATFVSILSLNPVQAEAASVGSLRTDDIVEVNVNALNVRTSPCGKVKLTAKKGMPFFISSNKVTYCKVNGVSFAFQQVQNVSDEGEGIYTAYLAIRYVIKVVKNNSILTSPVTVNAPSGLNYRDWNCKVKGTLKNNTKLNVPGMGGFYKSCRVNNVPYHMYPVEINGNTYLVASFYIK